MPKLTEKGRETLEQLRAAQKAGKKLTIKGQNLLDQLSQFEPVNEPAQQSGLETALETARKVIENVPTSLTDAAGKAIQYGVKNPVQTLEAAPIGLGTAAALIPTAGPFLAPVGGAIGKTIEQAGKAALKTPDSPKTVKEAAKRVGKEALIQAAIDAVTLGGSKLAGPYAKKAATPLMRRFIGFTKRQLNKVGVKGGNEAADFALEKGLVDPLGSITKTLDNVKAFNDKARDSIIKVEKILDDAGVKAFDPEKVSLEIIDQLDEATSKGKFANRNAVVQEIIDTVNAFGYDLITFSQAQKIKNIIGNSFNPQSVKDDVIILNRATGIINKALEDATETAAKKIGNSKLFKEYMNAKRNFKLSKRLLDAANERATSSLGNNAIGLKTAVLASGQVAAGNPGQATATLATGSEFAKRGGGIASNILNVIGRGSLPYGLGLSAGAKAISQRFRENN